jgi:hypothetical protein
MASAFQGVLRTLLALGLCALSYLIGRYGPHQPHGAETAEFVGVAAAVLALAVWSWRRTQPSHGAAEFTANVIRHGLTLTGAALTTVLCVLAAFLGVWSQHG